jgi:hypothetical protein
MEANICIGSRRFPTIGLGGNQKDLQHSHNPPKETFQQYSFLTPPTITMQVRLSLLAAAITLNAANAQPLTQNCGSSVCQYKESVSCVDLMQDNVFTGTCCSLEDTDDGGCNVFVSAGICYWEPYVPCDGCMPGTNGKFLGSGSVSECPVATYNAIAPDEPAQTAVPAADEETAVPLADVDETDDTDETADTASEDDPEVNAYGTPDEENSAASTMGMATIAAASAAVMFL